MISTMRFGWFVLAVCGGALSATGSLAGEISQSPVRVALISELAEIVPGQKFRTGVTFDIDEGWHLYWNGRNDSGTPVSVETILPKGFTSKPQRWPAPRRLVTEGGRLDHIYEDEVTMVLVVQAPLTLQAGETVTLACRVQWAAAGPEVRSGAEEMSLTLPVAAGAPRPAESAVHERLQRADARLPRPWSPKDPQVHLGWSGSTLEATAAGALEILFYPGPECGELVAAAADTRAESGALHVRFVPDGPEIGPAQGILELAYPDPKPRRILRFTLEHPGSP